MQQPKQTTSNKSFYTQFPKDTHQTVTDDSRLQWDALYNLKGKQTNILFTTLTTNANLDTEFKPNSVLIWILTQDTVGGWTPTWAKNSDGSLKFKGTPGGLAILTTANTYTALVFWCIDAKTAYLVAGVTGGNLV